ncbi:hypothetical protein TEA_002880 [Camellia sinensis var. sinensis]|uniref:TCTP domain-containing protein n=1 Tax=Camellia sinensis var. sinensis TaxID=542762 RepID=A0A4V3WIY0_CAMSN|nr:hypothetical protein TEA_002880 [Camellia sinensis var. sinensis]
MKKLILEKSKFQFLHPMRILRKRRYRGIHPEERGELRIIHAFEPIRRANDELLSDSFPYKEIENGILWEVEGKKVEMAMKVFVDKAVKVVNIVDTFRLHQPAFDKRQFVAVVKKYIKGTDA